MSVIEIPKNKRWRSLKYLKWIRTQPCCFCGGQNSEVHHIKGVGHFSGTGMKSSSILTMPLCRDCHKLIHDNVLEYSQQQLIWALETIDAAFIEGICLCQTKK